MPDFALTLSLFGAALGAALLTWLSSLVGLRLFPNFRSREQKPGEYRRDAVSAAVAGTSRQPCVVGPAMLVALTLVLTVVIVLRPTTGPRIGYLLALCWAEWLLGWVDDWRKSHGLGLGERVRLAAHALIALAAAAAYLRLGFAGPAGIWGQAGSALLVVATILYLVLSAGFSDGIDGLTSGLTLLPCLAFAVLGGVWGLHPLGLSAGAATGIAAGALLVNTPSNWTRTGKVRRRSRGYIGDSGALLAGALVAGLAVSSGTFILVPLLAAGFVVEGGSVFLQTGLLTPLFRRGLRLRRFGDAATFVPHTEFPLPFLATPLHHHLNLIGLKPLQIVLFLWLQQAAAMVLGIGAILLSLPWLRVAFGLAGVLVLLLPPLALALTKSLFLGAGASPGGQSTVAMYRGLPLQLWSWRLYRPAEPLPEVRRPEHGAALAERPLPRYEVLCSAARLAACSGQAETAAALLRRVPPLNLLLRPQAAMLAGPDHELAACLARGLSGGPPRPAAGGVRLPGRLPGQRPAGRGVAGGSAGAERAGSIAEAVEVSDERGRWRRRVHAGRASVVGALPPRVAGRRVRRGSPRCCPTRGATLP
jgi:UDP-N-acetylmuramyl pentapeptide phosphotransferase/UDP-N-acetylglucosamine-1-phosphate transferase